MTDGDLRALLARWQIPRYVAAAHVGLHPSVFAQYTSGRRPIPASLEVVLEQLLAKYTEGTDEQHGR